MPAPSIVPAVLAVGERYRLDGKAALDGIVVGIELMCRLGLVAPKMVHKAGFHPTAVFGAMGAAAAVGKALRLNQKQMVDALGVAGRMASGIIEYLAEGTWTKRMHAGWAAQSGMRAALFARAGFSGPRTVFEGRHGFFHGFANTTTGNFDAVADDFGTRWLTADARLQALSVRDHDASLHRLRAAARRARHQARRRRRDDLRRRRGHGAPAVGAARRASRRRATATPGNSRSPIALPRASSAAMSGLSDFTDEAVQRAGGASRSPQRSATASIPNNPYPDNFTGHIRATLRDGSVIEERQPHMRGGAHEPLSQQDIEDKFLLNARHGGYDAARAQAALKLATNIFGGRIDLSALKG